MTGKLVDLGERPDAAAAFKLLGNLFLLCMVSGLAEMLSLAKALDVSPEDAASLFGIVLIVCLLASGLGVRTALKIDPASALAG